MASKQSRDRRSESDRREDGERRSTTDRRGGPEGRHVVLHLGRTHLHMGLIIRDSAGKPDLLHFARVIWQTSDSPLPSAAATEALRLALRDLVATERLAGCEASLILNGQLCVTRVTTGSTQEVSHALEKLDDRSQLYLSLGPGTKTTARCRTPIDARHEQAVVTVACERTVRSVIEAAEEAGLELRMVEAEPVALARAHSALHDDEHPVILVDFDDDGFEIAVAHKGVLLLDYRPGGVDGIDLSEVLDQHHVRLQRYCQRRLNDYQLKLEKVYLAGTPTAVAAAAEKLKTTKAYRVEVLDVTAANDHWNKAPEALDSWYGPLLGRVLREIDVAENIPVPNLMEQWIVESRKHMRPILLRSALPIAAVLLLALGMGMVNFMASRRTAAVTAQVAQLSPVQVEHNELRLKLLSSEKKLTQLQRLNERAPNANMIGLLDAVSGCMPQDVWLERLTVKDLMTARIAGASYTEPSIYDFVGYLESAPNLSKVALEGTGASHSAAGPTTSFDLNFVLAMPAPEQATLADGRKQQ